jgi:hypothetical protein
VANEDIQTWYEVSRHNNNPEPVAVVKYTAAFVVTRRPRWDGTGTNDRREARRHDGGAILPTWQEARAYIIDIRRGQVESLEMRLNAARKELAKAESIAEAAP